MSVTFQKIKATVARMWVTKQGYLGKSCQVGRKLPNWAFFCNDGQVLDTSLRLTAGAGPAASWWPPQSRELVQWQLWTNFETTWWRPLYRSWAQVRCSATPGTQTGRLWLLPTAIGRWRWSRRTRKHFVPLLNTVCHYVTLCNTLQHTVTLVHRWCCTHGRVANNWPSSTSTTSGWPGSTGLPGRSRENFKL